MSLPSLCATREGAGYLLPLLGDSISLSVSFFRRRTRSATEEAQRRSGRAGKQLWKPSVVFAAVR